MNKKELVGSIIILLLGTAIITALSLLASIWLKNSDWGVLFGKKGITLFGKTFLRGVMSPENIFYFSLLLAAIVVGGCCAAFYDEVSSNCCTIFLDIISVVSIILAMYALFMFGKGLYQVLPHKWWAILLGILDFVLILIAALPKWAASVAIIAGGACLLGWILVQILENRYDSRMTRMFRSHEMGVDVGENFSGKIEELDCSNKEADMKEARKKDKEESERITKQRKEEYERANNEYLKIKEEYFEKLHRTEAQYAALYETILQESKERIKEEKRFKETQKELSFLKKVGDLFIEKSVNSIVEAVAWLNIKKEFVSKVENFEQIIDYYKAEYRHRLESGNGKEKMEELDNRLEQYENVLKEMDALERSLENVNNYNKKIKKLISSTNEKIEQIV